MSWTAWLFVCCALLSIVAGARILHPATFSSSILVGLGTAAGLCAVMMLVSHE